MAFKLPAVGYVFWPVGTGDSTSVCIDDETVMQVDLHNLVVADDDDDATKKVQWACQNT